MIGLWRCANYAFAPNFYKYCGPDKNRELVGYINQRQADLGLKALLDNFSAMHPYLQLIARENGIKNEFDEQVVEAYWLGNKLLEKVTVKSFFNHIQLKLPKKELKWFELKLPAGAKPNHQFHVFNFINRTGNKAVMHTVETMDNCRISWGRVMPDGKINSQQLIYQDKKLKLVPATKSVKNLIKDFKTGDLVTFHWGWVCEKITKAQIVNLEKYTNLALALANLTI